MRDKIAAVLADVTVDGHTLDAHEQQPQTLAAWQAWPVWSQTSWLSRCAVQTTYQVLVALPSGDSATWTQAAELLLMPVRDALERIGHVESAEPVAPPVQDASNSIPCMQFTFTIASA